MTEREKFWMDVYIAFINRGGPYVDTLTENARKVADDAVLDLDKMLTDKGE